MASFIIAATPALDGPFRDYLWQIRSMHYHANIVPAAEMVKRAGLGIVRLYWAGIRYHFST